MAQNINSVVVSGNLTRDPELRQLASGSSVCGMRIAVNTSYKDRETGQWSDQANYFDVSVFGRLGEVCAQYLQKGSGVTIQGSLRWREWDAQDGSKRQAVSILADRVEFKGTGQRNGSGGNRPPDDDFDPGWQGGGGGSGSSSRPASTPVPAADEDDIPF